MKTISMAMMIGLLAAGCSLDKGSVDAACRPPFIAEMYDMGKLTATVTIANDSLLSSEIQDWLKANPTDWDTSYITFAPRIIIRNDGMSLNFTGGFAVLNVKSPPSGKWKQLIKKVDISSIEFLEEIKTKAEPAL